ncbi:HypA protein [Xylaria sp. CBS 124048]|nr:HypA protein [Xylaria sp. CBS 124048]
MATSRIINITPDNTGLWHIKQTEEAAQKLTQLLQSDLEKHHCFFNNKGFHNHISHHLLALYGIGGSAEQLQKGYDDNDHYQRTSVKTHPAEIEELKDFEKAKTKLGNELYYTDFLVFYQNEIDRLGWQAVLQEYLFKGDERSEDLLSRLFESIFHPMIQLMYGVEWEQPAIIAMGLAQASVHPVHMRKFMLEAEKKAAEVSDPMPPLTALFDEVASNPNLATSTRPDDADKIRDGVLGRAFDDAVRIASKVHVMPEQLDEKTVEMFDACIQYATAAAVREGKEARFDFHLMHHVTVAPFFLTINSKPWVPQATKVRLLECKMRYDILECAARACPEASRHKITSYIPRPESKLSQDEIISTVRTLSDDGHITKLLRALRIGNRISKPYHGHGNPRLITSAEWEQIYRVYMDSVTGDGPRWVRDCGRPESWEQIPNQKF